MDAAQLNQLCKTKSKDQKVVLEYFLKEPGCFSKTISDEEYMAMVMRKLESLKLKAKALGKIGLDIDQVSEISPVNFDDFYFDNAYAKKVADGSFVSSTFESTWIFFSSTQIYFYTCRFWMDEDKKKEETEEYFYRDVTSLSTSTTEEKPKELIELKSGCMGKKTSSIVEKTIESTKFKLVVPGASITVSMKGTEENEQVVQAMKQKLREKKSA